MGKLRLAATLFLTFAISFICFAYLFSNNSRKTTSTIVEESTVGVYIKTSNGTNVGNGSGTIIKHGPTTYVLTCAHVASSIKSTQNILDIKTGKVNTQIIDNHFAIRYPNYENGKMTSFHEYFAYMVGFSVEKDIALLVLEESNVGKHQVKFAKTVPYRGEELAHCGNFAINGGFNSITFGNFVKPGMDYEQSTYDCVSCMCFPGGSGGGVFKSTNCEFVGMITNSYSPTMNLMVPIREIRIWANQNGFGNVFE